MALDCTFARVVVPHAHINSWTDPVCVQASPDAHFTAIDAKSVAHGKCGRFGRGCCRARPSCAEGDRNQWHEEEERQEITEKEGRKSALNCQLSIVPGSYLSCDNIWQHQEENVESDITVVWYLEPGGGDDAIPWRNICLWGAKQVAEAKTDYSIDDAFESLERNGCQRVKDYEKYSCGGVGIASWTQVQSNGKDLVGVLAAHEANQLPCFCFHAYPVLSGALVRLEQEIISFPLGDLFNDTQILASVRATLSCPSAATGDASAEAEHRFEGEPLCFENIVCEPGTGSILYAAPFSTSNVSGCVDASGGRSSADDDSVSSIAASSTPNDNGNDGGDDDGGSGADRGAPEGYGSAEYGDSGGGDSSDSGDSGENGGNGGNGGGSGGGGGGSKASPPDDGDKSSNSALPYLEFSMTVDGFGGKVSAAATVPEVSELHGNEEAGHWRLLVYPRSHRGDEQWCSAYLAAAVDEDALGHGWWKKVDFSITAVHHTKESSVTRRGTNTFKGRGTTLAHNFEWGYNDLIKVDTLLSKQFLTNDSRQTLTLKVELTVLEKKDGVPYTNLSSEDLQDDLIWAVGVAAVPMVRDCLRCHADPGAVYDTKKMDTPLHKAASTPGWRPGAAEVVRLLLEANAPVNAVNELEETPLLLAADVSGCAEICACLLEFGADPTFRTDNGWSPMNCAAKRGRDDILKLLVQYHCPLEEPTTEYSALLHAAAQGHVNTVLLLLSCGADANVTDRHGDTALWKLVDQDLSEAALYMVQDHHASIARCSRDRKKVTKARLMLKHVEKKQRQKEAKGLGAGDCDKMLFSVEKPLSAPAMLRFGANDGSEVRPQEADIEALQRHTSDQLMEELLAEEDKAAKEQERKANKRKKKKDKAKTKKRLVYLRYFYQHYPWSLIFSILDSRPAFIS